MITDKEILELIKKQLKKYNISTKPSGFTYNFNPQSFLIVVKQNIINYYSDKDSLYLFISQIIKIHTSTLLIDTYKYYDEQ